MNMMNWNLDRLNSKWRWWFGWVLEPFWNMFDVENSLVWGKDETVCSLVENRPILMVYGMSMRHGVFLSWGPMQLAQKCYNKEMFSWLYGHLVDGVWTDVWDGDFCKFCSILKARLVFRGYGWWMVIGTISFDHNGHEQMVW